MTYDMNGKRVLVTHADRFMGPACAEEFSKNGAEILADASDLKSDEDCQRLIEGAGLIDVLIVNLAAPNLYGTLVTELDEPAWQETFSLLVHPLHGLVRHTLPEMIARRKGKIIVFGSATPLRPMGRLAAYSAARGAQISYVKSVGVEVARHNVQVNLIAQNWVENPAYYPPDLQANPKFQKNLKEQVPIGRLAKPEEDVALALFLASDQSDFFVGQAIPFAGGWAS
ncbi:SDR family oxidoreductase [Hoeflea prorocentri]|uniref:SDR family oxidoreductase n=1 Tax=Hoeflea prorocentri TaxID=1922333 RepID=A0A9X3UH95_9HYPH|nr:SDR family oxidoreductase [Hoeflea prorocentri]MCY6380813.1 SDR family oxidoreductase [Hoeflea prorocentri]MDA5398613.1 SDR family oxidoreductase [Hoeflea prorocentri]